MAVSWFSPGYHIIPQLAVYTTYILLIGLSYISPIPPIKGSRNSYWWFFPCRAKEAYAFMLLPLLLWDRPSEKNVYNWWAPACSWRMRDIARKTNVERNLGWKGLFVLFLLVFSFISFGFVFSSLWFINVWWWLELVLELSQNCGCIYTLRL